MSTCAKRALIQVGDRPARVKQAALAVQSAADALQQRTMPHSGSTMRPSGRQLNHGALGKRDPIADLARALTNFAREVDDAFSKPQGPVGNTGGIRTDTSGTKPSTNTNSNRFDTVTAVAYVYSAAYTEPMEIPIPTKFRPITIIAGRIDDPSNPDRFFRSGVACDWKPGSNPNKVTLRSIDGMTIGDPTIIQYTFIYFGYGTA